MSFASAGEAVSIPQPAPPMSSERSNGSSRGILEVNPRVNPEVSPKVLEVNPEVSPKVLEVNPRG